MMNYYGYKYNELIALPTTTYTYLRMGMIKAKARDTLQLMENASYPNMKKDQRRKVHKRVYKEAQTLDAQEKRAITTEELGRIHGDFGSIEAVLKEKNSGK